MLLSKFNDFLALIFDIFVPLLLSCSDKSMLGSAQTAFPWIRVQCCSIWQECDIHREGDSMKCAKTIKNEEMNCTAGFVYWLWCFPLPDPGTELDLIISLVRPKLVPYRYHVTEIINATWRHCCCSLQSHLRVSGGRALL